MFNISFLNFFLSSYYDLLNGKSWIYENRRLFTIEVKVVEKVKTKSKPHHTWIVDFIYTGYLHQCLLLSDLSYTFVTMMEGLIGLIDLTSLSLKLRLSLWGSDNITLIT